MAEGQDTPLWQQHQSDEILKVVTALRDGDLLPLARYLSSGGLPESPPDAVALPQWLADELIAMIEKAPWSRFRLKTVGRKQNEQGWTKQLELDEKRWKIGYFAERNIRETGERKRAIWRTGDHFKVGPTTVTDALKFVREYLKRTEAMKSHGADGWAILNRDFSADYEEWADH